MATNGTKKVDENLRNTFEDMVGVPENNSNHLTPATRLLEKRREMAEVEQALTIQKEEFQMKMKALQQRRDELERKEKKLKENLVKFDKFLMDNDMKRARALKKTKEEQELGRQKDREIERLQQEQFELSAVVIRQTEEISGYSAYKKFMERVVEQSDEFNEAHEVIARHDTLTQAWDDLISQEQESQEATEIQKTSLKKFTEDKNNEILACNNELAHLQAKLEEAQTRTMKWESEWIRIQTTSARKTMMLGQMKMATLNLYTLIHKYHHRKVPAQEAYQTLLQLNKVQTFLKDMTEITHEIKRHESLATSHLIKGIVTAK